MASARPFLDRPLARVLALVVFVACAAALAYLHRDDLLPRQQSEVAGDDPFARCFAERRAEIESMQAEGMIDEQRAELFVDRAEAMCRAETGEGGGPPAPPLPGQ